MADATPIKTIKYGSSIWRLVVTKDASIVVTGSDKGEIIMWNVADGARIHTLANAHSKYVYGLNLTRNEQYLLSCSNDRTINMWRMEDGKRVAKLKAGDEYRSAVLSGNNCRYFTGSLKKTIKVWCNFQ